MMRSLTQYDIRNALQKKVSPFFSASMGSIQAALKKLENNGCITLEEVVDRGRRKKLYSINEQGRHYFMDWMLSPIPPNRLEQDAPTRLFFLGLMSRPERSAIVRDVIIQLEHLVHEYEATVRASEHQPVPEPFEHIVQYQLKTLDLGLYHHRSMLDWFRKLASELEGNS